MIKPYYEEDGIIIYNNDCLEIMPQLKDKSVDLVLTDPPYGKQWARGKNGIGVLKDKNEKFENVSWDTSIPTKEIFGEIFRISKNQIIFGGNYFTEFLPPSNCWIVWDKLGELKLGKQIPFAHCELLWTSFKKTVRKYTLRQQGFINDSKDTREHPTQKPTELIKQILIDWNDNTNIIFDPFLGSGTTLVACKELGRRGIGIEISEKYCEIAVKRLRNTQKEMFIQ
jgi:site-specific DNA-methyltransferase (adenine-specific)